MLVVKIGGGEGIDLDACCADVATQWKAGQRLVLIHGGSGETNRISEQLGHPPRFVTSVSGIESRYTDRETRDIFAMVYAGKVQTGIVERLQMQGVNAVGLSGLDGRLLEGPRKESLRIMDNGRKLVLHGDYTGKVEQVNTELLTILLGSGYLPVLCPLASSYAGEAINVDGDRAAARVAVALGSETLIILSNVPGLLARWPDPTSLVTSVGPDGLDAAMEMAQGRMKKKVMGAREALEGGVRRVVLGDARVAAPISTALAGQGTVFERKEKGS
ncbi:MAG: [LysW]-aminoadipate kinase [Chloroflexota bacterium]